MDTHQRSYPLLYVFAGLYCGFLLGASLDRDVSSALGRVLYAGAILLLGFYWRRVDSRAHRHNVEVWHTLRTRGKWYFIATRYLLLRGGLLLAITGAPFVLTIRFSKAGWELMGLIAAVVELMMVLLGLIEWRYCEQDFQILVLKEAAKVARLDAALHN